MRTSRWTSGSTLHHRLKNKTIYGKLEVVPIKDKIRQSLLRWFCYVPKNAISNREKADFFKVTAQGENGDIRKLESKHIEITLRHVV